MREVRIILRREYLERVRTRAYILGTLIFPVFMGGILVLPNLFGNGGGQRTLVVVDETDTAVGMALVQVMMREPESEQDYRYDVERVSGPFEPQRAELNRRIQSEEIDGYLVLPPDVLEENRVLFRARSIANRQVLRDITLTATAAIQAERLRRTGLSAEDLTRVLTPVDVDEAEIRITGEEGRGAAGTFLYAYIVAFLNYFMVAFYGMSVMRSVLEEKTSRISEVMVSSVRAGTLMLGKILGVSFAALLQVGIWVGLMVFAAQSELLARLFRLPADAFSAVTIEPAALGLYIGFFVLGFLLYAAIFAALGAAVTSEQEAQSFQVVVMLPLFVPMLFLGPITNEPMGTVATAMSFIPLSAPIAMPMRLATAPIPSAQVALSFLVLILAVLAVAWLAGKIYRIGILTTGRRPSLRELARWLRQA